MSCGAWRIHAGAGRATSAGLRNAAERVAGLSAITAAQDGKAAFSG
jgi:hypothetical protein